MNRRTIIKEKKKGKGKVFSITVITPSKPEVKVEQTTVNFRNVYEKIGQIQNEMMETFKDDMQRIDSFKRQEYLHSVNFYWWALGSYTTTQASVINILSELQSITGLCMELEKRQANGVPVSVHVDVDVPKEIGKELQLWFQEREAAKKAQGEYIK